jgi:3-deoxy-manno-octulosonate cytidylyltransferase (CMP-KDO synthetase)
VTASEPSMFDVAVVIPARLASTRFPRKVLADINGKPMIQHVYERSKINMVQEVYVATEDQEIVDVVHGFGGKAINTGPAPTVLHRCSLAAGNEMLSRHEMVVVVQGDEPMVTEPMIRGVIQQLGSNDLNCSYRRLEDDEDPSNPNLVKVALSNMKREIGWLSRSPIPTISPEGDYSHIKPVYRRQVCIMAFRTDVLARYRFLFMRDSEMTEGIDVLRFIENGYRIQAVRAPQKIFCVDVPEDLEQVKKWLPHAVG